MPNIKLIGLLSLLASPCLARSQKRHSASIVVDASTTYQALDGFGCSEAFQRAEDVLGKEGLSAANQSYVLDLLFDKEVGAGFTILRNGIGSSNSSASNFMKSIEPYSPGSPSAKPNYTWDHYNSGQFPLAQDAYKRGLKTLYAEAWSAPGYMKTNDDENYGGLICGVEGGNKCTTGNWMQAYANYLVEFAKLYKQSGVDVTHLGFINEPQETVDYASMNSNGKQAAEFIRLLAKTVRKSGLDLSMTCCDSVGWNDQEAMLHGLTEGPDPAIDYLDVVTGHGYNYAPNFTLSTTKPTWLTEWADLSGDYTPYTFFADGGPGEGLTWARNIQVAFVHANVSAFLYWIGAENATSNSALIDLDGDSVLPTKRFWAFAQFSKFARPGAHRVKTTSSISESVLGLTAFKNSDGSMAVQVVNNSTKEYEVDFSLRGAGATHGLQIQPYLTDNNNDLQNLTMIQAKRDGSFVGLIPARSMVSFITA